MLKHQHYKDRPVKLTFPDGSHGYIHTDRRCDVYYDLPPQVKIEARNEQLQKDEEHGI